MLVKSVLSWSEGASTADVFAFSLREQTVVDLSDRRRDT
jgi:hypothetical protein